MARHGSWAVWAAHLCELHRSSQTRDSLCASASWRGPDGCAAWRGFGIWHFQSFATAEERGLVTALQTAVCEGLVAEMGSHSALGVLA